jgi:hypothetical protein
MRPTSSRPQPASQSAASQPQSAASKASSQGGPQTGAKHPRHETNSQPSGENQQQTQQATSNAPRNAAAAYQASQSISSFSRTANTRPPMSGAGTVTLRPPATGPNAISASLASHSSVAPQRGVPSMPIPLCDVQPTTTEQKNMRDHWYGASNRTQRKNATQHASEFLILRDRQINSWVDYHALASAMRSACLSRNRPPNILYKQQGIRHKYYDQDTNLLLVLSPRGDIITFFRPALDKGNPDLTKLGPHAHGFNYF